jgi:hypothetical protein
MKYQQFQEHHIPIHTYIYIYIPTIMTQPKLPDVVKTIISHTPVITIFIGGMVTIPKWVVYCCFKGVEFDHDHRSNDPSMLVRSMLYHGKTHSDFFTEVHILSFPIIRVPQKYCFPYSTYTNSLNDNSGSMTLKP